MTTSAPDLAAEAAEISRIHDEGRYDQYGEHPAESIGTLLDFIAAQSAELEQVRDANYWAELNRIRGESATKNATLRAQNERLQYEIASMRKPVGASDRELVAEDYALLQEIRNDPLVSYPHSKLKKLLRLFDAAQREIARLSSPPEERPEIVARQSQVVEEFKNYGWLCLSTAELQMRDIETLLQDCARYRNANAVLRVERDAARERERVLREALQTAEAGLVVSLQVQGQPPEGDRAEHVALATVRSALAAQPAADQETPNGPV